MSMRISTSWSYQQSLSTMLSQQAALAGTQNQVSSGKRINVASDDPAGAAQALAIDHTLSANNQYTTNIGTANTRLSTESTTLDSITDQLDSARSLALQAINGVLAPEDRASIATNLQQIRAQLMQLANTADANGDALFSGTSSTKTPFIQNADGSVSYAGTDGQMMMSIGSGLQVAIGDAGSGIFMNNPNGNGTFVAAAGSANTGSLIVGASSVTDPATYQAGMTAGGGYTISFDAAGNWSAADAAGNPVLDPATGTPVGGPYTAGDAISFNGMTVAMTGTPAAGDTVTVGPSQNQDIFSTINNMISALQGTGSDADLTNAMNRQIESLDQTQASVTNTQVLAGSRLGVLDQQGQSYADLSVTYQDALSGVQDADPAATISQLSLQSAALQASQQVFAKVQTMTLFDYIK
jgi:flagellar hook-associated protein 3 FlgL